ncbi:MAG: benzoate-CoA ligase family protein [Acidobacteriota bacterium]
MQDHEFVVGPAGFTFGPAFNAAVPFVDRHLREGRGGKVAIRSRDGREVTYAELSQEVDRWGRTLKDLGVQPGERQLMVIQDTPEFFFLFWGAIKAGVIPVPVNTLLRAKDYRYMLEDARPAVLVYAVACGGEVLQAADHGDYRPPHVLSLGAAMQQASAAAGTLMAFPSRPEDDCFWLYSSGSTGFPKAAVHRHRSLAVTSVRYGVETLGLRPQDTFFSAAKLFFAYGLGNAMCFPLWVGGTAILVPERPTPALTFEIIEDFKPTVYFGVPTLYAAQLSALEDGDARFESIRLFISAGEALPADILARWRDRTGGVILDGIGSTEALHIFISNTPTDYRAGTSGRPVAGYRARIVDDAGHPVAAGESGRLQIAGDSVASHYWNQREKTLATMLEEGWLDTGDTYRRDPDGYFVYEGRSDDMMKVGGIWTSPIEIEAALIQHPAVLEVAVVAATDEHGLVKPEAWVVRRDPDADTAGLESELEAHVKSQLAPYKYPRSWRFVDELPKTVTGKIQRFKLRQAHLKQGVGSGFTIDGC